MLRNLVILAAVILIVLIVRNRMRARPINNSSTADNTEHKDTVQCSHCRHFMPIDDAVKAGELFFCNNEHQQAWQHKSGD